VTKSVAGDPHLYEASVALQPGVLNVLLGPTLAGKTSMMRLFAGLDRPTTVKVLVDDREVAARGAADGRSCHRHEQGPSAADRPHRGRVPPAGDRRRRLRLLRPADEIEGRVAGGTAVLGEDIRLPLAGHLSGLAEGHYRFGVRAHHLFVQRRTDGDVAIPTRVEQAEVSGSETFIHAEHGGMRVVVQEEGVHGFELNEALTVYADPGRLFAFGDDGRLIAAPGGEV